MECRFSFCWVRSYWIVKAVVLIAFLPLVGFCCEGTEKNCDEGKYQVAGISEMETGVLSVSHQKLLFESMNKVFSSPEHRDLDTIIQALAPNGNYIKRKGDDNIDRYIFTFYSLEDEVNKLSVEYEKIKYLAGVTVLYKDGEYVDWSPRYVTRFRGKNEGSQEE